MARSIASEIVAGASGGKDLQIAGNYVVYASAGNLVVVDASVIGNEGAISTAFKSHVHASAQLGIPSSQLSSVAAAIHPIDKGLYVLVEGRAGFSTTGFALLRSFDGGTTLNRVGSIYQAPPPFGGTGSVSPGVATLLPTQHSLLALFWGSAGESAAFHRSRALGANSPRTLPSMRPISGRFPVRPRRADCRQRCPTGTSSVLFVGTGAAGSQYAYRPAVPTTGPASLYTVEPCRIVDSRQRHLSSPTTRSLSSRASELSSRMSHCRQHHGSQRDAPGDLTVYSAMLTPPDAQNVSFQGTNHRRERYRRGRSYLKIRNRSGGSVNVI
jgi:hypothetical protein